MTADFVLSMIPSTSDMSTFAGPDAKADCRGYLTRTSFMMRPETFQSCT
jgi:hypothetical protein